MLTALNLPQGGGMELLRSVKRHNSATPVVILTNQGSVEHAVDAMKEGAADFLLKPVTVDLMEELAKRMLGARARPRAPGRRRAAASSPAIPA